MVGSKIGKINSPRPITLNAECVLEVGVGVGEAGRMGCEYLLSMGSGPPGHVLFSWKPG